MDGYDYTINAGIPSPIIMENKSRYGIIQRSLKSLFSDLEQLPYDFSVKWSFVQIYNEHIYDLLNPTSIEASQPGLKMRWNKYE